ncbi:hypothetical protein KJK34_13980 [Flavobacterium sp. D11R37]|uniref:hypothetical protein n=1 Tax=Flavobacterium coralii TaxID=2838017 RepID=UPI001CA6050C|nr:hypothetical protein [Flavobacterium coralii]MBY8963865.1 hypothetical protein [Flavobacterium coralii]
MKYEKMNKFIKTTGKSRTTIYRFYEKNPELKEETKLKGNRRYIPEGHAKYFDSEKMFDEYKTLEQQNKSMRNLLECLADKDSFPSLFWHMDWSFFYTIAYKTERNKKSCFKVMTAMYEHLLNKFGEETGLRLFFTTEQFTNRKGCHSHFVIHVDNKKLKEAIVNEIAVFFEYDRVEVKIYDRNQAGVYYIAKDGLQGEDWDFRKDIRREVRVEN